jgi:hypothetical protein
MNILNNASVRKTGHGYWLASPYFLGNDYASGRNVYYHGSISSFNVNALDGVRPAISLISGTEYVSGDGSTDNPYIVD